VQLERLLGSQDVIGRFLGNLGGTARQGN